MTKEEAIKLAESKFWEDMTDNEIVRFQLFEPMLCMPFDRFHEAVEHVFKRPVYTHEFRSSNFDNIKKEFLGDKEEPTLDEIIGLIPKEKRIIIGVQ